VTTTITLYGEFGRKLLYDIAYRYAVASVERVATVRGAPEFTAAHEQRWRDIHQTLKSCLTGDGEELPPVGEPEWPLHFSLRHDYEATRSMHTRLKKGAKKKPTYVRERTWTHAKAWAASFVTTLTGVEYVRET
jgi:hypothetical protein